jgi:hypothetical protein
MCNIDQFNKDSMTRLVIECNSPYDVMKYTLNFRSYLPIPNGLEFHSNQTYYFLSTSTTNQQCNKLKIIVHDHSKYISSFSFIYLTRRENVMSMFWFITLRNYMNVQ